MATYAAVPTVNTGDLWTAGNQNTYLKGNFDFAAEDNAIRIFPDMNPMPPGSGIAAAAFDQLESSDAGTLKPLIPELLFDAAADEGRIWAFRVPQNFGSLTSIEILYYMKSANTSDDAILNAQVAAGSDGDTSFTAIAFDAVNTVTETVPDAVGELDVATITLTNADSMSAGDWACLALWRDADNGSDTAAGDLAVVAAEILYSW